MGKAKGAPFELSLLRVARVWPSLQRSLCFCKGHSLFMKTPAKHARAGRRPACQVFGVPVTCSSCPRKDVKQSLGYRHLGYRHRTISGVQMGFVSSSILNQLQTWRFSESMAASSFKGQQLLCVALSEISHMTLVNIPEYRSLCSEQNF